MPPARDSARHTPGPLRSWYDAGVVTPKEQFDCCAKQAELAFNSRNARRDHEFKITLGLWGLLLLTVQFLVTKLDGRPNLFVCVGLAAVVVVIHAAFVCGIWLKSGYDEKVFFHFRRKGAEIIAGHPYDPSGLPEPLMIREFWGVVQDGSSLFQIGTTLLLTALCVGVVLWGKPAG